jgi:protein arginine kinase activator
MQCTLCHKNAASMSLKRVVEGTSQELHVCRECAAKHGFDLQLPIPLLTDMLLGTGAGSGRQGDDRACVACHMHHSDFHKTSLLGCPDCYAAFEKEIRRLLVGMHKGVRHYGKIPRRRTASYLKVLEGALEEAGETENRRDVERLRAHLKDIVRRTAQRPARAARPAGASPGAAELPLE